MKNIRKYIARIIYRWADRRYGVRARGEVAGYRVVNGVGLPNMTPKQYEMLGRWQYWMKVKNRVYDVTK